MQQITSYDIRLFTQSLKEKLDIDFTEYAGAFLRHRLGLFLKTWGIPDLEHLLLKLTSNSTLLDKLLEFISVETTEMFRDPGFWRTFNKQILTKLDKKDNIKILVPFITSDDELFTLLVLLDQNNMLDKSEIIATSPFEVNIKRTKAAIFNERKLSQANDNYKRYTQNPEATLNHYFSQQGTKILFSKQLIDKVNFLVSDILNLSTSNEFDLILFRNRMIYFNLNLQNKILEFLFYHLAHKGYLIIGFKENLNSFLFIDRLKQIDKVEKIFIKTK